MSKMPTLEQAKQVARYSWPADWDIDTADVPAVLVEEIKRLERELAAAKAPK